MLCWVQWAQSLVCCPTEKELFSAGVNLNHLCMVISRLWILTVTILTSITCGPSAHWIQQFKVFAELKQGVDTSHIQCVTKGTCYLLQGTTWYIICLDFCLGGNDFKTKYNPKKWTHFSNSGYVATWGKETYVCSFRWTFHSLFSSANQQSLSSLERKLETFSVSSKYNTFLVFSGRCKVSQDTAGPVPLHALSFSHSCLPSQAGSLLLVVSHSIPSACSTPCPKHLSTPVGKSRSSVLFPTRPCCYQSASPTRLSSHNCLCARPCCCFSKLVPCVVMPGLV